MGGHGEHTYLSQEAHLPQEKSYIAVVRIHCRRVTIGIRSVLDISANCDWLVWRTATEQHDAITREGCATLKLLQRALRGLVHDAHDVDTYPDLEGVLSSIDFTTCCGVPLHHIRL